MTSEIKSNNLERGLPKLKSFFSKKPTILILSPIAAAAALIGLDNVFLYRGIDGFYLYFPISFTLILYLFLFALAVSAIGTFFSNIGTFSKPEYAKYVIMSGIIIHLLIAVRDAFVSCDLSKPDAMYMFFRGCAVDRIPTTVLAMAIAIVPCLLFKSRKNQSV